ncbi:MAG: ribosome biogenesis protein ytm1 [Bogoriella megaspora]|nr:MAG: ribosome biogenesis protein ytm1 [Bogoriella megaspora]
MALQTATTVQDPTEKKTRVPIQLKTRHKDIELPLDPGAILVPTSSRRYALSRLVNGFLETEQSIPFDFLINGQFLRTSLDDFLTANGISAEETLNVEYVRAILPPQYVSSFLHDDWVSSVDVLSATSSASKYAGDDGIHTGHERILSGSFDGHIRVWNMSSEITATSPSAISGGHTNNVKAVKFLSPTRIISSSLDRTIRLWKYAPSPSSPSTSTLTPSLELYGHRSSIDSLAFHAPTQRILSASQDTTIGVWSTSKSASPPAPANLLPSASPSFANKRRKPNAGPQPTSTPQRGPLALLLGHTANASAVIFAPHDPDLAHSVSHDHTLRTWDLVTQKQVSMTPLPAVLYSLCALPGLGLLAAGNTARSISLVDTRSPGSSSSTTSPGSGNLVSMTLRGHAGAVSSLAAAPEEAVGGPWGLVSAGFDGTCRVWDVRSVRTGQGQPEGGSVFVVEREGEKGVKKPVAERPKVFGVVWDRDVGIVSGGEDRRVQIDRGM